MFPSVCKQYQWKSNRKLRDISRIIFLYIINRRSCFRKEKLIKISFKWMKSFIRVLWSHCAIANVCFEYTNNFDIPKANVSDEAFFHDTLAMMVNPTMRYLIIIKIVLYSHYLQLNLSTVFYSTIVLYRLVYDRECDESDSSHELSLLLLLLLVFQF